MSTSRDELLACRFCGSEGHTLLRGYRYAHGSSVKEPAVLCPTCEARAPESTWNTRAATPKAGVEREAVAWRVRNDFGHWYITQDRAMADTYRDIEKLNVEPLYTDAILSLSVGEQEIVQEEAHATRQSPSRAEDPATETAIAVVQSILSECGGDFHVCAVCGNQDDEATRRSDLFILLNEHPLFSRSHSNEQSAQGRSRATGSFNQQDDIAEQNYRDGLGPDGEKYQPPESGER